MKSKGAKKNIKISSDIKQRRYSQPSPGALNLNYYIKVIDKNNEWKKAKIVECRLRKEYKNLPESERNSDSYSYYIHFTNTDRRMDCWVNTDRISSLDEFIGDGTEHDSEHEHEGMDASDIEKHEEATRIKTISNIKFGQYSAETWYYSPFPDGYHDIDDMWFCEFCLNFFTSIETLKLHSEKCKMVHPPGNEIYRDYMGKKNIVMWEVDGFKSTTYCENLSLLSKIFLDHKLVSLSITPFLYYILTEQDEYGYHVCGYFSKDKDRTPGLNLSCILMLPFHQRKGYGKYLIHFSYALSKKEKIAGTPEKPLSDLGKQTYLSYWTQEIITYIESLKGDPFSIKDIVDETMITAEDVITALENVNLIKKSKG